MTTQSTITAHSLERIMQQTTARFRNSPARALLVLAALLLGSAGSRAQAPRIIEPNIADAYFGWSVAAVGDVNKDGYADVLIGAPGYSNGIDRQGAAYLYLGGASGLSASPSLTLTGGQAGAAFGTEVAAAGDTNNDGYADVIVGAPGYNGGTGRAYVYRGIGGVIGLNPTPLWTGTGSQAGARYGAAVSSSSPFGLSAAASNGTKTTRVASFNNDAFSDIVVGAPLYDNAGLADEGRVYVYLGSASGPAVNPVWTADSNQAGAQFGSVVAGIGWTNKDNFADLAVGAQYFDGTVAEQGRVTVYRGTGTAAALPATATWTKNGDGLYSLFGGGLGTAGDVNNDTYWDLLVGAWSYLPLSAQDAASGRAYLFKGASGNMSATPAWTRISPQTETLYGISVMSAGKFNTDSYYDVVVGAPSANDDQGLIEAFYGNSSALSANPSWTTTSAKAKSFFGFAAATAGDVNKDGKWDLLVGAPFYGNGEVDEGAVYYYVGGVAANPNGGQ